MSKKSIQVTATWECGRCSNVVKRVLGSTPDGLIELPNVYCGRCVGHRHLSSMSMTISQEKVIEEVVVEVKPEKDPRDMTLREMADARANENSEIQRHIGHSEVPEGGDAATSVGGTPEGRQFTGETDREDGSTGKRDFGGMPAVVKGSPPKGRSAK